MSRSGLSWTLAALLAVCTLGGGGTDPLVMLLVHGGVVLLVATEFLLGTGRQPVRSRVLWPLQAFLALALAGAGGAAYGYGAVTCMLEWAVFLGAAWLAFRGGGPVLRSLAMILPAAALLQVGYVLFRRLALSEWRSAGTFFNPNHLAAWLVVVVLLLVGTRDRRPTLKVVLLQGVTVLVLFTGLVLSGSRGGFVGLAAGGAYLLLAGWPALKRRERVAVVAAAALAGIVATGAMVQRFQGPDRFAMHRVGIWTGAAAMARDHPWVGVGPNQFNWNARQYQFPDGEGDLAYDHLYSNSHSDWLRLPAEFGIPGTVFLALTLLGVVWVIRKGRKSGALPPSSAGAIAALLALLVQSAFQNLSHSPAVYLTAAALIGGLLGRTDPLPSQRTRNRSWRGSVRPGSLLACVALLVAFLVADVGPYLAYRLTDGAGRKPTRAELQQATRYNRLQPYIRMALAESYLPEGPLTLDEYRAARVQGEEAVRMHEGDAELRRRLARIEARACRELFQDRVSREQTLEHYLAAEALAPAMAMIPLEAGDFLLTVSDPEGAAAAADRALALEPDAVPPRLLKAAALLDRDGARAIQAAGVLLDEARALAAGGDAGRRESGYGRVMLAVDPAREAAINRRIDSLSR